VSVKQIFIMIVSMVALMGGCAYALEGSNRAARNPDATIAATFDPSATGGPSSGSNIIEYCNDVVATQPGDVAIVLTWGWKIVCVQSGDPILFEHGDEYTLGYADPVEKVIAIAAEAATWQTVAHEAAHVIQFEQLVQADMDSMASKYGADSWDEDDDYWNTPSEMFAEGRARCLGYGADVDFGEMSCEDIDSLIAGTEMVDQIISLANTGAS
jgi:hypothetical protein